MPPAAPPPSVEEQIIAVLTGTARELATRVLGVPDMSNHSYAEVFTITRADVETYVAKKGLPEQVLKRLVTEDSVAEGLHLVRGTLHWRVYWCERGNRYDEMRFLKRRDAERYVVQQLLAFAGIGWDMERNGFPAQPGLKRL